MKSHKALIKSLLIGIPSIILFISTVSLSLNAEEVYNKVNNSVYTLYTVNFYEKRPVSLGSAIAVTEHVLATNCHVALTGNYLGIVVNNEFKLGTLFFRDSTRDICFVEVPGFKFAPVKIRASSDVKVGEQVYAVGNPEGLEKSITGGIVSNKRKDRGGFILQTDANVSFGSSGGGLFDKNANLIGLTFSVDKKTRNIAFAIPTEWISQILFSKAAVAGEEKKKLPITTFNAEKVGVFGRDQLSLYRINQRCFVYFIGKNEFGDPVGSAIWYPKKPDVILVVPGSQDVQKTFQVLNKVFYENKEAMPVFSKNFLTLGDKNFQLVGVKDESGKFPVLVTKLPAEIKDTILNEKEIRVTFKDGVTVEGFTKIHFGLGGFRETMTAYNEKCN